MPRLAEGQKVWVRTDAGTHFPGSITNLRNISSEGAPSVEVQIDGDPFPVDVDLDRIDRREGTMPTKTARTAKELRQEAKALGIEGYSEMTKAELLEAVETAEEADAKPAKKKASKKKASKKSAKKSTSKKSTAKKASAKKASTNGDGPNPFREGTNLYHITEALIKGGKRQSLINKLKGKLEFNPRKQDPENFDAEEEIDRRLKAVSYILEKDHGFTRELEGRGRESTIKVTPPA